ncbi:MAG TPA: PEGA domain-containing protein [Bacteroidota bacterium]|nr:PEGA domain-containing protein [Bacteroidota bacterium]
MKRSFIVLASLFLTMFLHAQTTQTRGIKVVEMQDEKGQRFVAYENSYALIVGINKYQDPKIPTLNYAIEDARAIAELLQDLDFPKENIRIITNEQATLSRIKQEFADLGTRTKKNDRLLFYWAGHGETESLPRGGEMGYLIPHDGKLNSMYATCLSMDEIKRLSDRVAAKHVLLLVDACYGGLSAVVARSIPRETELYLQKVTSADAVQIITAGTRDEQVVESSTWGHSAFAKALLDGFRTRLVDKDNNSVVTADELYSYLQAKVFELSTSEHPKGHRPVFASLRPSEGQFAFVVAIPEYSLTLKGLPPNNSVYIAGKKVSEHKESIQQKLKRGTYTVEVEAQGWERFSTIIDLSSDRELRPEMKALSVLYTLETTPPGAAVKIDGVDVGQTPIRRQLAIGEHRFEISKQGYETVSYSATVNEKNAYEKRELRVALLDISVISNPRGAQVFLNDLPQGNTPANIQVRPGSRYTVEVQYEGKKLSTTFQPAGQGAVTADFNSGLIQFTGPGSVLDVKKEEGPRTFLAAPPIAPPQPAYLEIAVEPKDAQIMVDGRTVSQTEGVARVEVQPGRRVVRAVKSGYDAEEEKVDIKPGETKKIPLTLSQGSSPTWWYYVAGGAVLAGGAAYFLLAKKAPASSTTSTTDPYGSPPPFPGTP